MLLRAVAKTHRDGLKIRWRQLHGGSTPPPGTTFSLLFCDGYETIAPRYEGGRVPLRYKYGTVRI